ncbi:MAG: ankyrin repeat domain-containing protein [Gammaproteobacteria bacterium]|nr:ankyrin repeat domain-containing protein [Gammaproteobacteria bacterium]
MLQHGAKSSLAVSDGLTPLHIAAQIGNLDILKLFLETHLGYMTTTKQDNFGETPLFRAIGNAPDNVLAKVVQILLKKDSSAVNINNEDNTSPLELALLRTNPEVIKLLINNGATITNKLVSEAAELMKQSSKQLCNNIWFLDKRSQSNNNLAECAKIIIQTKSLDISESPKARM